MKRSDRLAPVLQLAETREQQAALRMAQSQRKLDAAQHSLDNLDAFRAGYATRFRESGDQGLTARRLADYRAFLNKIHNAVADQEKALRQAEAEFTKRRADWEAARRHTLALRKLIDKAKLEESRSEERKLQTETDERASRRSSRDGTLLTVFL